MIRLISWTLVSIFAVSDISLATYKYWYKPKQIENNKKQEEADLFIFINKSMDLVNVKFSPLKKESLINDILRVSNKYLKTIDSKETFITMLGQETGYNNALKSPKGATGIGQLMPGYFLDFAKECNLKVLKEEISDESINLEVAACHFSKLVEINDNNPLLANLAYNGGQTVVEKFKNKKDIPHETALYMDHNIYSKELAKK